MGLTRISLRNFQCWDSLDVDLAPTVTVLVGESDRGKTAVLRALRWLCLNRPDGDSFIAHGESKASVALYLDGHKAARRKGGGDNSYHLDGKKYVSFGRGKVPDDISSLLNVGDLNFQRQHDPPYLFCLSPGEVARELNSVVDLGGIDQALSAAGSRVRSTQAALEVCRGRLKAARINRDRLAWVPPLHARWQAARTLRTEAEEMANKAALGRSLLAGVARATEQADRAAQAILGAKRVVAALETARQAQERAERAREILDHLYQVSKDSALPPPPLDRLERLEGMVVAAQGAKDRAERARELLDGLREAGREREEAEKSVKELERKIGKVACPACGRLL